MSLTVEMALVCKVEWSILKLGQCRLDKVWEETSLLYNKLSKHPMCEAAKELVEYRDR